MTLTSIERLKNHLSIKGQTPDLDPYFGRVIAGASALVQSMAGQSFGIETREEILNPPAFAEPVLILPSPIIAVNSFKVAGQLWPLVEYGSAAAGYAIESARSYTKFHANKKPWPADKRSIVINYDRGFKQSQGGVIPAAPFKVSSISFVAKTLAVQINGIAATYTAGTPAAGQYSGTESELTFAAADAGKAYTWDYAGTPADIELAVLDIAAMAYAARDRVGVTSKSLAGQESVSFSQDAVPPSAKAAIYLYKAVF